MIAKSTDKTVKTLQDKILAAKEKLDIMRQGRDPIMIALAEDTLNYLLETWEKSGNRTNSTKTGTRT